MEPTSPFRCFDRRYLVETLSLGAVLIGLALVGKRFADGTAPKIALGIAEAVVVGFMIARMLLAIRRLDELGQRVHLIAIAVAFGLSGLVLSTAEFLSAAGAPVPRPGLWLLSFMLIAWGIGAAAINRRYR